MSSGIAAMYEKLENDKEKQYVREYPNVEKNNTFQPVHTKKNEGKYDSPPTSPITPPIRPIIAVSSAQPQPLQTIAVSSAPSPLNTEVNLTTLLQHAEIRELDDTDYILEECGNMLNDFLN
jgi:hypothetical protein